MPGKIATNPHQGSRAEILADYLFSGWGTVTPVRRQDDHGIDLYCTLTEPIGRRSVVTDYYSVQVKGTAEPWVFEDQEEVNWLFEYPSPLFLACIDQSALNLSVYQTLPRFLARMWPPPSQLELLPSHEDEGHGAQWPTDSQTFSLSAPIIRVALADLQHPERFVQLKSVLRFWVTKDREVGALQRMGLLRLRMPDRYRVNEIPHQAALLELGMAQPTDQQFGEAVRTLVEVLDCVGYQLMRREKGEASLLATLLLRHIRDTYSALFENDLRWRADLPTPLEHSIASRLNALLYPGREPSYVFEALAEITAQLKACPAFSSAVKPHAVHESAPGSGIQRAT